MSSLDHTLYVDPTAPECDARKVTLKWTEPGLLDRNSNITSYWLEGVMGRNYTYSVVNPDPYRQQNRTFEWTLEKFVAETNYGFKVRMTLSTCLNRCHG